MGWEGLFGPVYMYGWVILAKLAVHGGVCGDTEHDDPAN